MAKLRLKRLLTRVLVPIALVFIALTIAGRSVGRNPLPWHLSFLAPLGENAWWTGFEYAAREGLSKQEILKSLGEPTWILSNDKVYQATEIDLLAPRRFETWTYPSPYSQSSGPTILFLDNKVITPSRKELSQLIKEQNAKSKTND